MTVKEKISRTATANTNNLFLFLAFTFVDAPDLNHDHL